MKSHLSTNEIFDNGYKYLSINDTEKLNEDVFKEFKFYQLLLECYNNLNFNSEYFKRNENIKLSSIVNLYSLNYLNRSNNLAQLNIINEILLRFKYYRIATKEDIRNDRLQLEKYAKWWNNVLIADYPTKDELSNVIINETRRFVKLKHLKNYNDSPTLVIFKLILKSFYCHIQSKLIYERLINKNFQINGKVFTINYASLYHTIFAHYGEVLSDSTILKNKTYHITDIDLEQLPQLLKNIIGYINKHHKYFDIYIHEKILFKFKRNNYCIYISKYKFNKDIYHLRTIFPIDENNPQAKHLITDLEKLEAFNISSELIVFLPPN